MRPTPFCNNLRQGDQVYMSAASNAAWWTGIPREEQRETHVIFDGKIYAKRVDVMDLRFIPPNAQPDGTPEDVPPVDGAPEVYDAAANQGEVEFSVPDIEPLQVTQPLTVWKQIDALAAQIETPSAQYDADALKMAHAVIEENRRRAMLIRNLIPNVVRTHA